MQWGWEVPGCHGNGLGLSKMAALSAWVPSCLAGGSGKKETSKAGGKASPHSQRRAAELGLRGSWSESYNHFGDAPGDPSPTPTWQLDFGLPEHLGRSMG